jgi:hypothetical protein
VNGVHLLLGDTTLPAGFVGFEASKDHEAALGLWELIVFLLGASCWIIGLQGWLLGLALLANGATDIALHGSIVLKEGLCLPPVE